MRGFILKRLSISVVLLAVISSIVFLMVHMMPGDPALQMLGTDSSPDPAAVASLRRELGLDKPLAVQYASWMSRFVAGDLGYSYSEKIPVMRSIATRLPRTLELAAASMVLACAIGLPLGVWSAVSRGKIPDLVATITASLGTSVPVYVLGYVLIIIFALDLLKLGFSMPSSGYMNLSRSVGGHFLRLLLPAFTLSLGMSAAIMRMTRSSMLDSMDGESVRALRARGLSEFAVMTRHVMRNAFIPVVTVIGLQIGNLISGTVLCENVFNWPGLSTLLVKAINQRDYPLIQGCILVMASVFILTNLIVDIVYGILDPRVR
jgi:peptide/nickel transport system permease protein